MTTLLELRTAIRRRCDIVNNQHVSDAELTEWINHSAARLWDEVVTVYEDQYTTSATAVVTAPASTFPVPADFFKLRGVDRLLDGTNYVEVSRAQFSERNAYSIVRGAGTSDYAIRYLLVKDTVNLFPATNAPATYRLWYVPRYAALVADGDVLFDVPNNWHTYIIADVGIKVRVKRDEDPSPFAAELAQLQRHIKGAASNRDQGGPKTVQVVSRHRDE